MKATLKEVLKMDWLLIILLLILAASGYLLMDKIDNGLASPDVLPDINRMPPNRPLRNTVLLFGRLSVLDDIADLFDKQHFPFQKIRNLSEFVPSQSYGFLIAADSDDLENLTVCTVCQKMMSVEYMAAVCNSRENNRLFEARKIPFVPVHELSSSSLIKLLLMPGKQKGRMEA